jgi:hypothetical protein
MKNVSLRYLRGLRPVAAGTEQSHGLSWHNE